MQADPVSNHLFLSLFNNYSDFSSAKLRKVTPLPLKWGFAMVSSSQSLQILANGLLFTTPVLLADWVGCLNKYRNWDAPRHFIMMRSLHCRLLQLLLAPSSNFASENCMRSFYVLSIVFPYHVQSPAALPSVHQVRSSAAIIPKMPWLQ